MWKVIIVRWHGIILSLTSILYGSWLLIHPTILDNYGPYEIINQMFNSYFISIAFIVCGLGKILSILINNKRLRKIAIFAMAFFMDDVWRVFSNPHQFIVLDGELKLNSEASLPKYL